MFGEGTKGTLHVLKQCTDKPKLKSKKHFDFPDGGWECASCSNYNFKGRMKCHRCKKQKSETDFLGKPNHMFLELEEKQAMRDARFQQKKQAKMLAQFQQFHCQSENQVIDTTTPTDYLGMPRNGDWICIRCTNFNYSFRECCNKCGLMQYEHHYFSNNYAPNSIDWS